jgi:hypothetical protein
MDSFLIALNDSWLAQFMLGYSWAWPAAETLHFFGMTILFGTIIVTDLRLVGYFKAISFKATHTLINWAIAGFCINLITGIGFYVGDPFRYTPNWAFRIKVFCILLAGINMLYFTFKLMPTWDSWDQHGDAPKAARMSGLASIILWVIVIMGGRMIPYSP